MPHKAEFLRQHDYRCWCGEAKSRIACGQLSGRRPFLAVECGGCGTHRLVPRPLATQDAAEALYNSYAPPQVTDAARTALANRMMQRLSKTDLSFHREQKILDVGCGTGEMLERICWDYGCRGKGIDVDARRIEAARRFSSCAEFECGLFSAEKTKERYDVILSAAVIEHVIDPVGFLTQFSSVLNEGGSMFLLTPNASSLSYKILGSWWRELLSVGEHVYLFTPTSLARCAEQAGFDLVRTSSDFDFYTPRVRFNTINNALVAGWAWYREAVKRGVSRFAAKDTGDILYAHFRKKRYPSTS